MALVSCPFGPNAEDSRAIHPGRDEWHSDPDVSRSEYALIRMKEQTAVPDNIDIESTFEAALSAHESGDAGQAHQLCDEILRADPDQPEALNLLSVILQNLGRADESISLLSRAVAIDPNFSDAFTNLARGHRFMGDEEQAITAARRAIKLDPSPGEAWRQLGFSLIRLERHEEALLALREAIARMPDSLDLYVSLGFAARTLKDHETAAKAWRQVLRLQPVSYTHLDVYKRQTLKSITFTVSEMLAGRGNVTNTDTISVYGSFFSPATLAASNSTGAPSNFISPSIVKKTTLFGPQITLAAGASTPYSYTADITSGLKTVSGSLTGFIGPGTFSALVTAALGNGGFISNPAGNFAGNVTTSAAPTIQLTYNFTTSQPPPPPSPTPEPASLALLGVGLAGLGAVRRRRKS